MVCKFIGFKYFKQSIIIFQSFIAKSKLLFLTTVCQKYSKSKLMFAFGITKHQIDTARTLKSQFGACAFPEKIPRNRLKMNVELAKDFIDYLFESGNLHVTSFGSFSSKYTDGTPILAPLIPSVLGPLSTHIQSTLTLIIVSKMEFNTYQNRHCGQF